MCRNSQHVIPNQGGRWSVRKNDSARATRVFDNKNDAVEYARKLAIKGHSELYIHNRDGTIIQKNNYNTDTCTPINN